MKKLFVILFSLILFISCDSMDGDFEISVQKISQKEILDVQNSKKDTVEIVSMINFTLVYFLMIKRDLILILIGN